MSTQSSFGVNLVAVCIGIAMALPATGQEDKAQQAPSTASGQSAQGMDMSSMPGKQMPAKKAGPKKVRAPRKERKPSPPAAPAAGMQGMPGMRGSAKQAVRRPARPSMPGKLQHLHFGNMIGVRPQPGGLAGSMSGSSMPPMQGMSMSSMQGGKAPADARSPDYSDGYRYTDMPGMAMSDHAKLATLYLDQLEYAYDNHGRGGAFVDGDAWYGGDFNKLWMKAEGDYAQGALQDLRTEALWDHAVTTYWDTQLGVRHDFGTGPGRTWAALGIQGLAPYWFDTEATLYVGQEGRTAARVQFEYEELLTQRLVLQPKLEANLYGKSDPRRGIGSGLSDTEFGLRLRYEIRREFGPYVGLVWRQRYGRTADLARAQGYPASELQLVAGLHVWY